MPSKDEPKQQVPAPARDDNRKREPHIVPFNAKKTFRGDFAHIKTVKGGFKAEKLQQKKYHLNTIKNPFEVDSSSSEEETEVEPTAAAVESQPAKPTEEVVVPKVVKKTKKQQ